MPGYLYRRPGANTAPWQTTFLGTIPRDVAIVNPLVAPEMPDVARRARRAAAQSYVAMVSAAPRDAGLTAVTPEYQDITPGPRRTAGQAYAIVQPAPLDAGTVPAWLAIPARAPGPRLPLANYAAFVAGPVDAGLAQPTVSPEVPDLARPPARAGATAYISAVSPGVLDTVYWPPYDTCTDAAGTTLASHIPDTGGAWILHPNTTGELVISDANRLRSNAALEACYYHSAVPPSADYEVSCDLACFSNPTTDAPGVAGRIQPSSKTWYFARYRSSLGFQLLKFVSGTSTQLGSTYARVLGAGEKPHLVLRMVGTAISLLVDGAVQVGPITDSAITLAGFAGVYDSTGAGPSNSTGTHIDNFGADDNPRTARRTFFPDFARPAISRAPYLWSTQTPLDAVAVNPNVFPLFPDSARGPRLPLASYAIFDTGPVDAGLAQPVVEPITPDRARTAQRTARLAYAITVPAPGDSGIVLVSPALLPSMPDRIVPRPNQAPYSLIVAAPRDQGTLPTSVYLPDRSPGPRLPLANYAISAHALEAIAQPLPVLWPDRAALARRASFPAYTASLPASPRDAGLVQPIIPAVSPWRAPGARWPMANSVWVVASPPLPPETFADFPDPFGAVLIASADPFNAADPFGAEFLPTTDFAGADAQKGRPS